MTGELQKKYDNLIAELKLYESVAVAFSSGVDSTFLLKVAHDILGDKAFAVTARSMAFPERETKESIDFCSDNGISQFFVDVNELEIEGFRDNPADRCYHCKKELFGKIIEVSKKNGATAVLDGSNKDDEGDYRPGLRAIEELGVHSPLRELGFTKAEIRALSKELGLNTASKPSFPCLATRFVYGEKITEEKLAMVEKAEQLLFDMGFKQFRVRIHGEKDFVARIEVLEEDLSRLMENNIRNEVVNKFKSYGFSYVTMDIQGYRMGSMNEIL